MAPNNGVIPYRALPGCDGFVTADLDNAAAISAYCADHVILS
jgi:hypothetical protein